MGSRMSSGNVSGRTRHASIRSKSLLFQDTVNLRDAVYGHATFATTRKTRIGRLYCVIMLRNHSAVRLNPQDRVVGALQQRKSVVFCVSTTRDEQRRWVADLRPSTVAAICKATSGQGRMRDGQWNASAIRRSKSGVERSC